MNDPIDLLEYSPEGVAIEASSREVDACDTLKQLVQFAERLNLCANLLIDSVNREHREGAEDHSSRSSASNLETAVMVQNSVTICPENVSSSSNNNTRRMEEDEFSNIEMRGWTPTSGIAANSPFITSPSNASPFTSTQVPEDGPMAVSSSEAQGNSHIYDGRTTWRGSSSNPVSSCGNLPQEDSPTPRLLSPGYKGNLKDSHCSRSVGLTRHVLNEHLDELGLSTCFGQSVISKRGAVVSQITLNTAWNDLPQTNAETLEWWLGEGKKRFALTDPLDPTNYPNQRAIPIFWATRGKSKVGGSAMLCHYVGHFRCIRRVRLQKEILYKKRSRQALIELQFVKFDSDLAEKMAEIDS